MQRRALALALVLLCGFARGAGSPTVISAPPIVYVPSSATAPTGGLGVLAVTFPANGTDTLSVTLLSDATFGTGGASSVSITSNNVLYSPGTVTSGNVGNDVVSYKITDTNNGLSVTETFTVNLAIDNTTAQNNPTVTYNHTAPLPNWTPALAAVKANTAGARAGILVLGDSGAQGHGDEETGETYNQGQGNSWPEQITGFLTTGGDTTYNNAAYAPSAYYNALITYTGSTTVISSVFGPGAGGNQLETQNTGDGFDYNTTGFPAFDRVDVLYTDGGGIYTIAVDGGSVSCTVTMAFSAYTKSATCNVPAGTHTVVSFRQAAGSSAMFIQGLQTWSSTSPHVEVENFGVGGAFTDTLNVACSGSPCLPPPYNYGQMQGSYAIGGPKLALITLATNDLNDYPGDGVTIPGMAANYQVAIENLPSVNIDPVIVITAPFVSSNYPSLLYQWRAAAVQLAYATNVPVIDMSATFEDDPNALPRYDNLHANTLGYTYIAQAHARAILRGL